MKYVIFIIIFIILLNVGFSYKYFSSVFYGDSFDGIPSEISKLFSSKKYEPTTMEFIEIVDLLKKQPGIENSYVMSISVQYAYHSGSKFLYTDFRAGEPSDSLNDFIKRENWSEYELYVSNVLSYPRDKHGLLKPVADYVIYSDIPYDDNSPDYYASEYYQKLSNHADVSILSNPDNEELPSNFELLYKSDKTQTVVYKIHNIEN